MTAVSSVDDAQERVSEEVETFEKVREVGTEGAVVSADVVVLTLVEVAEALFAASTAETL